jgi:hypothetical protein
MSDQQIGPDDSAGTADGSGRAGAPATPKWVKVFALIALGVAVLVVILLLIGGGHGPQRHLGASGSHQPNVTQLGN